MSIRSAFASAVSRHRVLSVAATTRVDSPSELLELRLAPYVVTETSIRIPVQRQR